MYSKMITTLPIIAALIPATLAATTTFITSTTPTIAATATTAITSATSTPSATMISYFVDGSCNTPYNQAWQTVTNGECMDLGEDNTTRSIKMQSLDMAQYAEGGKCSVLVYTDQGCGVGEASPKMMTMALAADSPTCVMKTGIATGWSFQSAKLVCE